MRDINQYLKERSMLYNVFSEFSCEGYDCDAKCCKTWNMQIYASLFDLLSISKATGKSITYVFNEYCEAELDLRRLDKHEKAGVVHVPLKLGLKKPCPLLEDSRCSVQEAKPLACVLFPENVYFSNSGKEHPEMKEQDREPEGYGIYPCTRDSVLLNPRRADLLFTLYSVVGAESKAEGEFLFSGTENRIIDISAEVLDTENSEYNSLVDRLGRCHFEKGIERLETPEGRELLFSMLKKRIKFGS